ncbi:hypothetical protein Q3G72_004587 [Acer saccharum]|nr:hypothetical protein Q3G72_004587 [Acer saccharum]
MTTTTSDDIEVPLIHHHHHQNHPDASSSSVDGADENSPVDGADENSPIDQFFGYRREPLSVSSISAQIAVVPLGYFMSRTITGRVFFKGQKWEFTLNPGPFNVKEHVLITIFANAGAGNVFAIQVVSVVRIFYRKQLTFFVSLLVVITTQVLGFGWAGVFRRYLVEPAAMWWPQNLVQVSLFRALHEKEERTKDDLFTSSGQIYNISAIIDSNFHFDNEAYKREGPLYISTLFAMSYGVSFACLAATVVHVLLFHGREIWNLSKSAFQDKKMDVHTKLMRRYKQINVRSSGYWDYSSSIGASRDSMVAHGYHPGHL